MNFKWHTRIALGVLTLLTILISCLGVLLQINNIHQLFWVEVVACWILGYFNTVFASPDIDQENSIPTQNMGIIGWITSHVFGHRTILHKYWFWTLLYIGIGAYAYQKYNYVAWWLIGGLVTIYVHLILDALKDKYKKTTRSVKRALHL
jgi:uncharacterized metal-binding protein